MNKANVLISKTDYGFAIKVEGRASMECSPSLRNFGENIIQGAFSKIIFEMKDCQWMDSTFMGTLAMLGLKARKAGIIIEMLNMDEKNRSLIRDLGIEGLFKFDSCSDTIIDPDNSQNLCTSKPDQQNTAETVLKAHETLVEIDNSNAEKFGKVIEMVKKEIDDSSEKH
ncbi:MAG TPA: hypothetical protein DD381_14580 [Lentisphaeria bacterium]|nr:MAG: hypothetical protein A2X47_01400 [Lentisphaerae bacterium GWF2_38_69]HBM17551.1 hypothetical protein [Lentisphaeria bacterium]